MPNDNVYYIELDVDFENKVFTVSVEHTTQDGKAHMEQCYICESLRDALAMSKLIKRTFEADNERVQFTINT